MLHGCSPRVRAFADFVASEIAHSRAGVRRSHHTPLNVRAKELPSSHPAPLVKPLHLKAAPHTRCWGPRRPVLASRLYHRSCPPIATICKTFASPTGESHCAKLMRSRGISGGRCRPLRTISSSHYYHTFAKCFRSHV